VWGMPACRFTPIAEYYRSKQAEGSNQSLSAIHDHRRIDPELDDLTKDLELRA
jgi:hypothetical protein